MGFSRQQNILNPQFTKHPQSSVSTQPTKQNQAKLLAFFSIVHNHTDHTYLMTEKRVKDATNRLAILRSPWPMAVLSEKQQKEKRDVRKDLEEHHTKMIMLNAALGKAISLKKKTSTSDLNNLIASATIKLMNQITSLNTSAFNPLIEPNSANNKDIINAAEQQHAAYMAQVVAINALVGPDLHCRYWIYFNDQQPSSQKAPKIHFQQRKKLRKLSKTELIVVAYHPSSQAKQSRIDAEVSTNQPWEQISANITT